MKHEGWGRRGWDEQVKGEQMASRTFSEKLWCPRNQGWGGSLAS